MKKIIKALPDSPFKGYYWLSNADKPEMVDGIFNSELLENGIPFIVEAALFNKASNISIFIKHNGTTHEIIQYDLNKNESYEYTTITLKTHRLADEKSARFIQVWKEEPDALCVNMKTLKPFAQVFAGFAY